MKVVAVSDVHLDQNRFGRVDPATGRSTALLSTLRCLTAAADHAIEIGAAAFITTGDETASGRPRPEVVELWADQVRRLTRAGVPVVALVGNHSLYGGIAANERTWNHRLSDIDGVHLIDTSKVVTLPSGLQIAGMAWPRRAEVANAVADGDLEGDAAVAAEMLSMIDRLKGSVDASRPSLFAGHLTLADASLTSDARGSELLIHAVFSEPMVRAADLADGPWAHSVLGHIHKRQFRGDGKVHYVGSIDRLDFGERNDPKGWSVIDAETGQVEFVESPARRMLVINEADTLPDDLPAGVLVKVITAPGERAVSTEVRDMVAAAGGTIAKVDQPPRVASAGDNARGVSIEQGISPLEGLTAWLDTQPQFEPPVRERIVDAAGKLAANAGIAA